MQLKSVVFTWISLLISCIFRPFAHGGAPAHVIGTGDEALASIPAEAVSRIQKFLSGDELMRRKAQAKQRLQRFRTEFEHAHPDSRPHDMLPALLEFLAGTIAERRPRHSNPSKLALLHRSMQSTVAQLSTASPAFQPKKSYLCAPQWAPGSFLRAKHRNAETGRVLEDWEYSGGFQSWTFEGLPTQLTTPMWADQFPLVFAQDVASECRLRQAMSEMRERAAETFFSTVPPVDQLSATVVDRQLHQQVAHQSPDRLAHARPTSQRPAGAGTSTAANDTIAEQSHSPAFVGSMMNYALHVEQDPTCFGATPWTVEALLRLVRQPHYYIPRTWLVADAGGVFTLIKCGSRSRNVFLDAHTIDGCEATVCSILR
ncbi:unnamed protein product [Amoebophrya sp. A120]|nr:unnamed protein product [Amoebophrya sp. A120]|eukprot:GSA120T00021650001.1